MPRTMLTDQHWSKPKAILVNFGICLKHNLRLFIEAILYRIRTGCVWWNLLEIFGKPNSILKKFNHWCKDSNQLKIFKLLCSHADLNGSLLMQVM